MANADSTTFKKGNQNGPRPARTFVKFALLLLESSEQRPFLRFLSGLRRWLADGSDIAHEWHCTL